VQDYDCLDNLYANTGTGRGKKLTTRTRTEAEASRKGAELIHKVELFEAVPNGAQPFAMRDYLLCCPKKPILRSLANSLTVRTRRKLIHFF
jgi:hypothetical protein